MLESGDRIPDVSDPERMGANQSKAADIQSHDLNVELKPMVEEEPSVEVTIEEEQAKEETFNAEVEGLLSLVAKLESELADIKKANTELSANVEKLSAQPAATSIKEVKQSKVSAPSKSYNKMSAEERFLFHLKK